MAMAVYVAMNGAVTRALGWVRFWTLRRAVVRAVVTDSPHLSLVEFMLEEGYGS